MDSTDALVARIAADCTRRGMTVAAIESLTSGAVASALGQGEDAAEWFAGGVVAYRVATKTSLLRVTEGLDPSTPECAAQLAAHGRELLAVDVCVAVTGVGGPEPSDGHLAGEVHLGLATVDGVTTSTHRFEGDPAEVVALSVRAAVAALAEGVTAQADAAASGTVARDARDARGEHDPEMRILPLRPSDAGEVLTIQRAAFVSEAQIYGSADMSPLTQTLAEVEAELEGADGWVARIGGRLVGVIRTRTADDLLLIGRIAIAPDMQGAGIGRRLLAAAEESTGAAEAELFTGSLSEANLRLYRDCGYVETERVDQGDGTAQVFLRKRLRD
ncbi:nicotinamide-nucleotide amidohydrolase family protein [Microbacterium aurum]|nr:nicotinamide-nucleotide amidohydrolase family protein [Microbacterium aurum]MBM7827286.1 PncC family amidohydrolase [Microbacterium aurum]